MTRIDFLILREFRFTGKNILQTRQVEPRLMISSKKSMAAKDLVKECFSIVENANLTKYHNEKTS
tara:strand:+ start:166 stop:360 length:195 start_codon:yes stop_codon:yes gene_type:complete